jgi:hypothetical protein
MPDPNLERLTAVARRLRPLLDELVFAGGCATGLLITDPAAPSIRTTFDVDAIAEITTYPEYVGLCERLRGLGFSEDTSEGAPVCRWVSGLLVLDVMPLDEKVLGFSNRWYEAAARTSVLASLEPSLQIRHISAPFFLATKLEAFNGRGKGDYFGSHDLEDALAVVDGRPSLVQEVSSAPDDLRAYLVSKWHALIRDPRFIDAIPGHLPPDSASQSRVPLLLSRIGQMSRP